MDYHNENRMEEADTDPSLTSLRFSASIFTPNDDDDDHQQLLDRLDRFITALSRNTQFRAPMFDGLEINAIPHFTENQFDRIKIHINCTLSVHIDSIRLLSTSLAEFDSLHKFALTSIPNCLNLPSTPNFPDDPGSQQVARELMQALSCHSRLRMLKLSYTNLGKLGCSALVDLLNNPNINLTVLDLNSNNLGDAEAAALSSGMAGNDSLKSIALWIEL